MVWLMRELVNGSYYYLSLLFILGLTLSLTATPSFITAAKSQFALAQPSSSDVGGKRPNILLIMGDDFGFSDIASFGSEIPTPNLDIIAKEGKILTNYHTGPVCSPARVAFLTGVDNHIGGIGTMYENIAPNQIGKPGYETYINDRVVTVQELLRDGGYHTMMSGKWHLSGDGLQNGSSPYQRGFEDVFTLLAGGAQHFDGGSETAGGLPLFMRNDKIVSRPDNGTFSNDLYTNIMLNQIKKYHGDGKPLFMYLSFQVAHSPFQAPEDVIKKYEDVYKVGYDKIREQRFEKQKQLGIWNADMKLPQRIPPVVLWDNLTSDQKAYRAKVLAVRAAMIEDMDTNIGRVIKFLKDIGEYDNTLIIFTSDNGSSEPVEMKNLALGHVTTAQAEAFVNNFNNTVSNIGNANSLVNYGAWGTMLSVSPLSYYKSTQGEGGIRSPFVIKLPNTGNQTKTEIVDAFVHVNDITPTFLEYAGVQPPGPTYKGHSVHAIMGKSIKSLLDGKTEVVHPDDEPIAQEMFNNTAVFMGDWKAVKNGPPTSDGKWHLFNITADIGENNDLASQYPEILAKLMSDYDKFAKDVGVIVPSGQAAAFQKAGLETD
jgi:arylsulfatase A-like enzyme